MSISQWADQGSFIYYGGQISTYKEELKTMQGLSRDEYILLLRR